MPQPTDTIALVFPHRERKRWWHIRQPVPSVAFALQGRIAASVGDAAGFALDHLYADEAQGEDFAADKRLMGEALALQTLRNARAGKGLFRVEDGIMCVERLWAVLRLAQARAGGGMDAITLLGEPERVVRSSAYKWVQPSLLHRLLLSSELRFDGEGDQPRGVLPDGPPVAPEPPRPGDRAAALAYVEARRLYDEDVGRAALRDAVADGGVTAFVAALDQCVCSPDELALLSAWAVLHLWRPF